MLAATDFVDKTRPWCTIILLFQMEASAANGIHCCREPAAGSEPGLLVNDGSVTVPIGGNVESHVANTDLLVTSAGRKGIASLDTIFISTDDSGLGIKTIDREPASVVGEPVDHIEECNDIQRQPVHVHNTITVKSSKQVGHSSIEHSMKKSPIIMFKWGSVNKPFRCQICDMSFIDGNLLRQHMDKHARARKGPVKPHPCSLCYKSFQTSRSLERHQFLHSGHSQKRCRSCYKVFANKENLDKHYLMHSCGSKAGHVCVYCNAQFVLRQGLETHMVLHTSPASFKCSLCYKAFNRKDTLERHIQTHDKGRDKNHKCVECGKEFSFMFALKRHVRSVHANEHDGKDCTVCGKFIKNRENMARHMQIHQGIRPHSCEECGRSFSQKQHLHDHMVIHTTVLPFVCEVCGLSLRYKRSLNRHIRKHYIVHSKTKIECVKCMSLFPSEREVIDHVKQCQEKPYQCPECTLAFIDEDVFLKHLIGVHRFTTGTIRKQQANLVNKSTETDLVAMDTTEASPQVTAETHPVTLVTAEPYPVTIVPAETYPVSMVKPETLPVTMDTAEIVLCNDEVRNNMRVNQKTAMHVAVGTTDNADDTEIVEDMKLDRSAQTEISREESIRCVGSIDARSELDRSDRANDGSNEEQFREITGQDSDQQIIYIVYENAETVQDGNGRAINEIISQTGFQVAEFNVQKPSIPSDGCEVIHLAEMEYPSTESERDCAYNDSKVVETVTNMENNSEELGASEEYLCMNVKAESDRKDRAYSLADIPTVNETNEDRIDGYEFVTDRSVLIQSLIDYAEKIHEEERLLTSADAGGGSETKI